MSDPRPSGMEDEARAWAQEHAEDVPPAAPGSRAEPVQPPAPETKRAEASDDDDDDHEPAVTPEEAADFAVGLIDVVLTNFVSERLEFKPKQHQKLVRLATPLARKYLPDVGDMVSPETAFIAGLGAICLKNYFSPETGAGAPVTPGGGNGDKGDGTSGGPSVHTEASVDGRPVDGQVLQ